jgi:hypothetical protein
MNIMIEVDALPRASALTLAAHILRRQRASMDDLAQAMGVSSAGLAKAMRRADARALRGGMRRAEPIKNVIGGVECPAVHALRRGALFRWHDGSAWVEGDELPAAVLDALPASERERLDRHSFNRTGRYLLPISEDKA